MIRRVVKPALGIIAVGSAVLPVPHIDYLEAVTRNLAELIGGAVLQEGDKIFSNFSYTQVPLGGINPTGVLTVPAAAEITVTASTDAAGNVTLSVPLGLAVSGPTTGPNSTAGQVDFGFDVAVDGSDVISAVTLTPSGVLDEGQGTFANTSLKLSAGGTALGAIGVLPNGPSGTLPVDPGLPGLEVEASAIVQAQRPDEEARVDEMVFTFEQTTPSAPVPEAGSLTLILGGLGVLLARTLYRRRG